MSRKRYKILKLKERDRLLKQTKSPNQVVYYLKIIYRLIKRIQKTIYSFVIRELNREWLSLVTAHGGTGASGPVAKFAKNVEDATTASTFLLADQSKFKSSHI